jgi:RHS repeat-associated protein
MAVDDVGRIVSSQDPQGNTVQTAYDALDRVNTITDPLGNPMQFAYDANGNLLSHTDQRANRTTYTYDSSNRLSTKKDAVLNLKLWLSASMLKQVTDRKGQVSGATYDAINRRVSIGFGATTGGPSSFDSTIGYSFDAGNRLLQATDSRNGNVLRNYDSLNRLVQEQTQQGIVSYTYDNAGRRTSMTVQGQSAVIYAYDNGNRLLQIQQGGQNVGFTYDIANRRTQTTLPNGVTINYAYDNANQFAAITYLKGTTTLGDLTYSYNAAGRRIGIGGSFARTNLPTMIASASYNANNQLMQWDTQTLTYDLSGNLTSDGTYTYIWNSRNQLTQVKQGVTVIGDYQYDAFGRRRQKTVSNITKQFLYDGQNLVQELNGAGSATANLLIGLELDELYARSQGVSTNSFLTDHLGTVIAEADGTGALQTSYSYEPYGNTSQAGVPSDNGQRYTGREQDLDSLYYYRARYYSPGSSRFIAEDPIGLQGGANLYSYVMGDPISRSDPQGLNWVPDPGGPGPKPPPGIPTIPPPEPPKPPTPPAPGLGCGALFRICSQFCIQRCPGGLIGKAGCEVVCVMLWVACQARGV